MKVCCRIALVVLLLAQSACSVSSPKQPERDLSRNWLKDGMIVLARQAPAVAPFAPSERMLAFMPLPLALTGSWLSVDTKEGLIKLMSGDHALSTFRGEGLDRLPSGSYQVLHKQKDPLWYAPDSYFQARALAIPPQGDKSRYRKGALGDSVIYIARDIPIHDGPLWSEEVGGIRVPENDFLGIYERLEIGAQVEIR